MSPRPARAPRARAGFTLVEVMLVLLIMSGLLVSISQVLHSARISRDTIHNIRETQLSGPAVLDLVEEDLRGLLTYDRDPTAYLRILNRVRSGLDADRIDFVSSANGRVRIEDRDRWLLADSNEVGYCLRPHPQDDDFLEVYRREDFGIDEEPFEGGHYTFLNDRVRGFDIRVFEEDGQEAEPLEGWCEPGDGKTGLPLRLEISLTLELAPRIAREQLKIAPVDKRTITYTRVIRLPKSLFLAAQLQPVPRIPDVQPPAAPGSQGGPDGQGGPGGSGGPGGGSDTVIVPGGDAPPPGTFDFPGAAGTASSGGGG